MLRYWNPNVYVNTRLNIRGWLFSVFANTLLVVPSWLSYVCVLRRCWCDAVGNPMFMFHALDATSDKRCIARTPLDAIPAKKNRQLRCIESLVSNKFSVPLGCTQRNAPRTLSECHLVAPSKLHAFSGSTEMMKKFPARVPAGQIFGEKKQRQRLN